MIAFNPYSNDHVRTIVYGGEFKEELIEPMFCPAGKPLLYKTGPKAGELKLHKVKRIKKITGLKIKAKNLTETGKASTDDKTLKALSLPITNLIVEIRALKKLIATYYESTLDYIDDDKFIHPQFSHCGYGDKDDRLGGGTDTGRLSCTKPNIQNQPRDSKVKEHFISRFENGKLLSADYCQIEVVAIAELSQDPTLLNLLKDGKDIHRFIMSKLYEIPYSTIDRNDPRRTKIKPCTFNIIYGGGPGMLAQQSGFQINFCKTIINTFYSLFPMIQFAHNYWIEQINKDGFYKDPCQRLYKFKKFPTGYSITQIKNWKVQGFATAGVVPMMIGKFWREKAIYNRDKYLMINTIHDSLMLDCRPEYVKKAKDDLKVLTEVGESMKQYFDYDLKAPVKIEIKEGSHWGEC